MDNNQRLTEELDVKRWQIDAAVQLIGIFKKSGRKERTGNLKY